MLIPPMNFGMVEDDLYRSACPQPQNFPFLDRLSLSTILYLAEDIPPLSLIQWANDTSRRRTIRLIQIDQFGATHTYNQTTATADAHSEQQQAHAHQNAEDAISASHLELNRQVRSSAVWNPTVSEETVISALQLILNDTHYPLLVTCTLGRHRTGVVIGCLRKLQRWALSSIYAEYRRYAQSKIRLTNEQFIELFDTDLVPIHNLTTQQQQSIHTQQQQQQQRHRKDSTSSIASSPGPMNATAPLLMSTGPIQLHLPSKPQHRTSQSTDTSHHQHNNTNNTPDKDDEKKEMD